MKIPWDLAVNLALEPAANYLASAQRVAAMTGAGASAESGLSTFRGADGLWEGHAIEDVATPAAFRRDPELVWKFYNLRRANLASARPNPGHDALVTLEKRLGSECFTLITQNVDNLHRSAGSSRVLELHGNLTRVRCTGCGRVDDRGTEPLGNLPLCGCGAMLRPDVVWFHEPLPHDVWEAAARVVAACGCFLVIGTSAVVYPAAGLIDVARAAGARVIEVNIEPTDASQRVDIGLYGPAGKVLPRLVERAGELSQR